jgi:hypothetical protein
MITLARTGKRSIIVSLAAVMLTIGLVSGFVYFAPSLAKELTQVSAPDSATSGDIGGVAASRKVQCIMPPAWRRACEQ